MKTYPSKIDKRMLLPLLLLMTGGILLMLILSAWAGLVIMLLTSAFIAHIFLTTFYQVHRNELRIKSGLLMDMKIDVMSIKAIVETRDAISSPALSFDRLYVKYNQTSDVIVSPKDKEAFIQNLLEINPAIRVERRPS